MSMLAGLYDPEVDIATGETKATITKAEVDRLNRLLSIAATAQELPRRLGADASDEELAADVTRCKRVGHVASQLLAAWGGKKTPVNVKQEAATVLWGIWWADHNIWLRNRKVYIASWAMSGGDERWAKTAIVRLTNEERWLEYALR